MAFEHSHSEDDRKIKIKINGYRMGYVENLRKSIGHDQIILVGSVTVVIDEMERILLQQRKATSHGSWGLPGGLMELKESAEETARREVFEESGLSIGNLHLLDVISGADCFIKVPNGDEFYSVTVAYFTNEVSGELRIDKNESLDLKFFKISELPEEIVGSHKRVITTYIDRHCV